MRIRVLGAAAGGGFPQWNCGCVNCDAVRRGDPAFRARTQDSMAVSSGGDDWLLLNASPDIHAQIESAPELRPRSARQSPIAGIVLTNGDLDHILGLFGLREGHPLTLYATDAVRAGLAENVILRTLQRFPGQLTFCRLVLDEPVWAHDLELVAFAVPGKRPVHLERLGPATPEDNIGVVIRDRAGRSMAYVPGAAALDASARARLAAVETIVFDGTFWTSDELVRPGLSRARAEDMAHWPVGGDAGSLAMLAAMPARRKIFTHVNNTNPMLREGSPERSLVEAAGVEVAFDGMELGA